MKRYSGTAEDDLTLAKWYATMYASGDLSLCISPGSRSLYGFLRSFQSPNILLYETDEDGICYAAWFEPAYGSASLGVWVAPKYRHSAHAWHIEALEPAFDSWATLLAITWQPAVAHYLKHLGFHEDTTLPVDPVIHVLHATREDFAAYKERYGSTRHRS